MRIRFKIDTILGCLIWLGWAALSNQSLGQSFPRQLALADRSSSDDAGKRRAIIVRPFNWTCPFCNRPQTAVEENTHIYSGIYFTGDDRQNLFSHRTRAIWCRNPDCGKTEINFELKNVRKIYQEWTPGDTLQLWRLVPDSSAKVYPECVPQALREDYKESCKIVNLSPKASATLARRCLQGAIRNFCGIAKNRLKDEIDELKDSVGRGDAPAGVTAETVEAIDHVRAIGNIGAHMEKDIDLIIEVDPGEATALIELIEMLFDEWYVAREHREKKLKRITAIAEDKDKRRGGAKKALPVPDSEEN